MTTVDERPVASTMFDPARYEAGNYTGLLEKLDRSGDTKMMWDKDNPAEVAAAKAAFDAIKGAGGSIFKAQGKEGEKGERMNEFDATAERLIGVPQLVGG